MYKINILGKTYSIQSSLSFSDINKIAKEINEKYKILENEYRTFDKVDILILYIIELYEMIYTFKKGIIEKEEYKNKIVKKVEEIEKDIETTLENLTNYE